MSPILTWGLIFIASLATLILSAEYFIRSAERIGLVMGIPSFIIGVTLVALGTSLPELITSVIAVMEGSAEIVPGNVVGSNISNICLIMGLIGIMAKDVSFEFELMKVDLPMMVGATFILGIGFMDGEFSLFEGIICLTGLVIYLVYFISLGDSRDKEKELEVPEEAKAKLRWQDPVILLVTIVGIYFSADYNVTSIVKIADILQIGTEFIALTAVSIGTSLPELIVSISAVRNGATDMAIGNVLGSNVFNTFAVMGIPRLFGEIHIPDSIITGSLPVLIGVTLLAVFIVQDKDINRWVGLLLVLIYILFLGNLSLA
ncbi:MAG: calcium/sodium antiporter [Bacteroidota bacterium]